jgi:hypothetical protein
MERRKSLKRFPLPLAPSFETHRFAMLTENAANEIGRHCERSEAIHQATNKNGLLRRFAPRNDDSKPQGLRPHGEEQVSDLMVRSASRRQVYAACVNLATMRVSNHEATLKAQWFDRPG